LTNVEIEIAEIVGQQLGQALSALSDRKAAQEMLVRDHLTGLFNNIYLAETFPREVAKADRNSYQLALLFVDADGFGQYNKEVSDAAGDFVLQNIGRVLLDNCRNGDVPVRKGGDEIVVLLVDCTEASAIAKAEALRQAISAINLAYGGSMLRQVTHRSGLQCIQRVAGH
jgi:diguanylate cyclase (GGDEF)-like protein